MFIVYKTITFLTAFGSLLLGMLVLLRGNKNKLNRIWFFFCLSVGVWNFGFAMTMLNSVDKETALLFSRLSHASGALIPALFINFIYIWLDLKSLSRRVIAACNMICTSLFVASLTPFVVVDIVPKMMFSYYPVGRIGYLFYVINFAWWVIFAHYFLFKKYRELKGYGRSQIQYLLVGTILGFFGGATCFPLIFNIKIVPYPTVLVFVYIATTTYAIIKYRLMDVRLAVTKAGVFIFVYTLVLGIPFGLGLHLLGAGTWLMPMALMAVFATAGPYIYMYIQSRTEKRLLYEQHQYQNTLRKASLGMGRVKDLNRLLSLIVHIVSKTVKIENASIYLLHESSNQFTLRAIKGRVLKDESESIISGETALIKHLKKVKEPVVQEEIKQKAYDYKDNRLTQVNDAMQAMEAALAIPSFIEDRLIAIIFLGKKKDGKMYTHDDLVVFSILSNQAALAIENAQFVEDTKKTHEQLFKAEKMATIGTMADGLSHQINNRLHAMGFIAGDALDTVKLEKLGKLPKVQSEKLLETMEHALERLVDNVKKGGEVVEGLLRYTRTGDEGFTEINLNDLIKASFEMVQYKIKIKDMDIVNTIDDKSAQFKGNFTQLQEVFFNLIDNAYDSIMQRKEELKEEGFKGRIEFSSEERAKSIQIKVKDNGMGVKKEDAGKLFTPFFTSKLSSKKGTGLGLYVIKQIIEENHKGRVVFNSEHKQGAEITIVLPKI